MTGVKAAAKRFLRSHGGPLGSIVRVRTDRPEFVLTYDDGPDPTETARILEVLRDHSCTATFFVLMTRARTSTSLLHEIRAAGHEIALHGPDHRPISRLGYTVVRERTSAARAELEDLAGVPVRWYRPPYGLQSLSSFRAVKASGLEPVLWGPTAWDSREATMEQRIARALRGAEKGAILLSHDSYAGYADGGRSDSPPSVDRRDLATRVLAAYRERGLHARSLADALTSGTPIKGIWFTR
ncbi:polysaccharide deacetylase family protein [Microbacterium sp. 1.5R]|uniref:polysaccharide deacetylase family protein n=1 Tax=Microbacterium sp. 1.5R TaxID=1916917 RepID=UPI0011A26DD2|nr:polysaccharide deacetylase family protein [Microbacterium sp. 1.5R]